jgi:hypothetical protein
VPGRRLTATSVRCVARQSVVANVQVRLRKRSGTSDFYPVESIGYPSVMVGPSAPAKACGWSDPAGAAAAEAARAELGLLRQRFLRGDLPRLGHLIVRHRLAAPGVVAAPWVLARSWRVPARLLGRCLNDATHPSLPHIRMGRLVVVELDQVIDWAVVDAFGSVSEGGWSRDLR